VHAAAGQRHTARSASYLAARLLISTSSQWRGRGGKVESLKGRQHLSCHFLSRPPLAYQAPRPCPTLTRTRDDPGSAARHCGPPGAPRSGTPWDTTSAWRVDRRSCQPRCKRAQRGRLSRRGPAGLAWPPRPAAAAPQDSEGQTGNGGGTAGSERSRSRRHSHSSSRPRTWRRDAVGPRYRSVLTPETEPAFG
jgi:hypothetical protein